MRKTNACHITETAGQRRCRLPRYSSHVRSMLVWLCWRATSTLWIVRGRDASRAKRSEKKGETTPLRALARGMCLPWRLRPLPHSNRLPHLSAGRMARKNIASKRLPSSPPRPLLFYTYVRMPSIW